jgi:AGCS family alanine or glycine:cation symporter
MSNRLLVLLTIALLSLAAFGPVSSTMAADDAKEDDKTVQQRVDEAFAEVNDYLIPVLFFDVLRGAADPDIEAVDAKLADARTRLADALALPEDDRDPLVVDNVKREVKTLSMWKATLDAKAAAPANLKIAREGLERLEKAAAGSEDELVKKALEDQKRAVAALEAQADATIFALPLIIVFLLAGGIFFTIRYGFINLRLFGHSIGVIRGKYDNPEDHGEISHFQALTSALSATVGLGNIAGVAVAISAGGAGAVFWMWVVAFFGMSSKFSSCTLAQMYRRVSDDMEHAAEGEGARKRRREHVLGGPMVYLAEGMKEVFGRTFGTPFGKVLAVLFAFFAIMGSLGGGNMFQGNQTFAIVSDVLITEKITEGQKLYDTAVTLDVIEEKDAVPHYKDKPLAKDKAEAVRMLNEIDIINAKVADDVHDKRKKQYAWVGGLIMAVLVGIVIVGGIRRIGEVTSKLVPAMCLFYVGVCLVIVLNNVADVPALLASIFEGAFSQKAIAWGGIMGVLVQGVKRGAFSNESGLGSAAIAHSAAKTDEPVREGVVAMIGPFIDTIIVCTFTALAILITGAHRVDSAGNFSNEGVGITASAFASLAPWLTYMLTIAVFIFAYSTMISWSYYGERASEYLFGRWGIWPFRAVFLLFVLIAPMISLDNVITFTDLLILSMAYPNILGMLFLSGKVARKARDYVQRLRSGDMQPYEPGKSDPAAEI